MNAAVVRRTQEALGKVIRRPPLTEKLLNKPPFRYLHDIITEVIRITGFMKGLYTDAEMKSENVKDKDAKISFLQKAIDVVVMVSGEPLAAKPARIVAGHEPERTNELLQLIGKCCLSKLSSDEAVKRVLAGEKGDSRGRAQRTSKAQEPDNKGVKEEESRAHKEDKRSSEVKERSASAEHRQKEELKEDSRPREKDRDRHRDPDRDRHRDPGEREKARARAKPDRDRNNKDRDREAERDRERDRRSEGGKEKEKTKDRDRDKGKDQERRKSKNGEHGRDPDRERSRDADKLEKKSSSSGEVSKKPDGSFKDVKADMEADISMGASRSSTLKASKRRFKNSLEGRRDSRANENNPSPEKEHKASHRKAKKDHSMKLLGRKEDNISAKILDYIVSGLNDEPDQEATTSEIGDNSAGLWRESAEPESAVKQKGDSPIDAEVEAGPTGQDKPEVTENAEVPSELPSSLRRIPRPGSARPAPPRVKRQESTETLAGDRSGSGKTVSTVIIDSQNSDNEDDEQFVVEAAPQLSEIAEIEMVPSGGLEDEEKHGGLVKKILETKKDYEKLQQSPKPGEKERSLIFESAWKKEKDIVSKEIEKLRESIQTLCKSALPLGKIMDYIQEDVDAMQNELQLWHSENRLHAEALSEEQSITDSAVEPLKAELSELEQQIRDQQDKICAVKANILKNEEKIQKMVHSINLSSRR